MSGDRLIERAIDEAPIGVTIADANEADNPLIYLNDAFERLTGYPKDETIGNNCRFLQGEGTDPGSVATMREAIASKEAISVELRNYRKDGTEFWNQVDIAPIRNGETVTHFVGFQTDVTARKRAEQEVERRIEEVERERGKLETVLERIDGLLEDITRTLVDATTREGLERAVCDRLTDDDAYDAAWIGERIPTTSEIVPTTWSGIPDPVNHTRSMDHSEGPVVRALRTGSAQFVGDVVRHETIASRETGAVAAIPLISGETSYGLLVVQTAQSGAFDEHERVVLESIGRAIANTRNTLESRRILTADRAVELEFSLGIDDLFFVSLSARADCRFEYEGSATDDDSLLFLTVEGTDPTRVRELAGECEELVDVVVLTANTSSALFEFHLPGVSLVTKLANKGVRIGSMHAEDGAGRLRLLVPGGVSSRSIVELVTETCPSATLVASHEHDRPPQTNEEYRLSVEAELTDRQLLALRKAYVSGYFDPNRRITGAEIAESMGISRSTFHQHLRVGERKILGEFFDRGVPD